MQLESPRTRPHLLIPLLAATAVSAAASADQQLTIWCGCGGGNPGIWSNAGNWDGDLPDNNGATTFNVFISSGFGTPVLDMNATVDKITIIPGNGLFIDNNRILTIIGEPPGRPGNTGVLANEGVITSNSTGSITDLVISSEGLSLTNASGDPGLWQMSANVNNRIRGATNTETFFIDSMQRIEGAGNIGVNTLDVDNHGTISGTHAGVPLIIDPRNADPVVNFGVLQAENDGILRFAAGTFENGNPNDGGPAGTMRAISNGTLELAGNVTVRHSALETQTGGTIRPIGNTVTLQDVQILGQMDIPNNISPRFQDGLVNTGEINVQSTGNTTLFYIHNVDTDGVQLTGGGTINLSNDFQNYITTWSGPRVFENVDNTIRGSGHLGNNSLILVNGGTIIADQPVRLEIDPNASGMVNTGELRADLGGTLKLTGGFVDNMGALNCYNASTLELLNATVHSNGGTANVLDGSLVNLTNSFGIEETIFEGTDALFTLSGGTGIMRDVTFVGTLDWLNNASTRVQDSFVNSGTINLQSSGNSTLLYVDSVNTDGVQLTGGGTINLSNNFENYITTWSGPQVFENVDNTIRGSGHLGNNSLVLVNGGTIIADQPVRLEIDPNASGMVNTGELRADLGGTLKLTGGFVDNMGALNCYNASTLELLNATVHSNGGTANVLDGSLVNLTNSFGIEETIFEGTDALFTLSGGTGIMRDVTFVGTLDWLNNASTRVQDSFVNSGTINLQSSGNSTLLYVDSVNTDGVQLTGGGTINLSNDFQNYITTWSGPQVFENVDNTIRGSGHLGNNSLVLVNGGTIIADQPVRLEIDPNASGMVNTGELRADLGGTLKLTGGFVDNMGALNCYNASTLELLNATVHSNGGTANVLDGSLVNLTNSFGIEETIFEGTDALFTLSGGTGIMRDVTFVGTLDWLNNASTRIQDSFVNSGTINLQSSGNSTLLYVDGVNTDGVQITGGGTINLSNNFENYITTWSGPQIFENVGNTIRGSGHLGNNTLTIINGGTIIADQEVRLEVDPSGADNFTNAGTLLVEKGSLLRSIDNIHQTGGETIVKGTLEMTSDTFHLDGGTLSGVGIESGNVSNTGGTLQPGIDIGEFVVDGTYTQSADGTLNVELGGNVPFSGYDVLTVDGVASLAGTLDLDFVDGFEPAIGSSFTVMSADDLVGTFDSVTGPGSFDVIYREHTVTVVVNEIGVECPADLNGSGTVDGADLGLLLGSWGGAGVGDLNDDGSVDGADLGLLLGAWGPCSP